MKRKLQYNYIYKDESDDLIEILKIVMDPLKKIIIGIIKQIPVKN